MRCWLVSLFSALRDTLQPLHRNANELALLALSVMHGRYVVLGIPICSVIERGVWAGKGLHPVALLVHASKYFVPTRYVQIYISIACRLLITIALNPFAFALLSFDISCDSRAKHIRQGQAPFCHAN
jgi:hypothetical protein